MHHNHLQVRHVSAPMGRGGGGRRGRDEGGDSRRVQGRLRHAPVGIWSLNIGGATWSGGIGAGVNREQRSLAEMMVQNCEIGVLTSTLATMAQGEQEELTRVHRPGGRGSVRVSLLKVGSDPCVDEPRIGYQGVTVAICGRARTALENARDAATDGRAWGRVSSRLMWVDLLFQGICIRILALYAPHAGHPSEQTDFFTLVHGEVMRARALGRHVYLTGDFNARLDVATLGIDVVGSEARQDDVSTGIVRDAARRLTHLIDQCATGNAQLLSLLGQDALPEIGRRGAEALGGTWRNTAGEWAAIDHTFVTGDLSDLVIESVLCPSSRVSVGKLDHVASITRLQLLVSQRQVRRAHRAARLPTPPSFSSATQSQWGAYGPCVDSMTSAWQQDTGHDDMGASCAVIADLAHQASQQCVPVVFTEQVESILVPSSLMAVHVAEVQAPGRRRIRAQARRQRAADKSFVASVRRAQESHRKVGACRAPCAVSSADREAHLWELFGADPGQFDAIDPAILADIIDLDAAREAGEAMGGPLRWDEFRAEIARLRRVSVGVDGMVADHFRQATVGGAFEGEVFRLVAEVLDGTRDLDAEDALWTGRVVWLHKRGDRAVAGNYRTLMVQCMVRKLCTGVWLRRFQRLYRLILHPSQGGFQEGVGATDTAAFMYLLLQGGVYAGMDVHVVSCDLRRAFDCVPMALVINILRALSVPEHMIRVIERLSARAVYRERGEGGVFGPAMRYLQGLPQGCLLSPTLFVVALELGRRVWMRGLTVDVVATSDRLQVTSVLPIVPPTRTRGERETAAAGVVMTPRSGTAGVLCADQDFRRGMMGLPSGAKWVGTEDEGDCYGDLAAGVGIDGIFFADDSNVLAAKAKAAAVMASRLMDALGDITHGYLCASIGRGDGSKLKALGGGKAGERDAVRARRLAGGLPLAKPTDDPLATMKGWEWQDDAGDPILVQGETVTEVGQLKFVGAPILSNGETSAYYTKRLGLGDGRMREHRRFWGRNSELSKRAQVELFLQCVVPTVLQGCEVWLLSVTQLRHLDNWFFTRLRVVLGLDYTARQIAGVVGGDSGASFAACMNRAEDLMGRALLPASALVVQRRLGMFRRMIVSLAAAQETGRPIPYPVLAAFQWRVHAGDIIVEPPTQTEALDFLAGGTPGSWREQVTLDMARAVPPLSLADAGSKSGWLAGVRSIPISRFHIQRSGAATGPRRHRGPRRLPAASVLRWETTGAAAARDREAVALAQGTVNDVGGYICSTCGERGHKSNTCVQVRCGLCAERMCPPWIVGGHRRVECTTSHPTRRCLGCGIGKHQVEVCPIVANVTRCDGRWSRIGGVTVEDGWEFFIDEDDGVLGVGDSVAVMRSGRQGFSGRVGMVVNATGDGKVNVTLHGDVALSSQSRGNFQRVRRVDHGL